MTLLHSLVVVILGLAIEAAVGYPSALYDRIRHPVVWIGALIGLLDRRLNREAWSPALRRAAGVAAIVLVIAVAAAAGFAVELLAFVAGGFPGMVVAALFAATLFAARSLNDHVAAVSQAMREGGLEAGRLAVSKIVGRNPEFLDEAGVCRATIESLAESLSDGVVAPVLWSAVFGLPGGAAYKAINTADSMIGHKTERHGAFGWAAARIDDVVNLPASRLSALMVIVAALSVDGASASGAFRAVMRDAERHKSPNAGWPEAAFAGALGLRLNGPKVYGDVRVDDAWMGDGRSMVHAADIDRALTLYRNAVLLLWMLFALLALLVVVGLS